MKNPQEAFDTLRSEFLLEVKSGKLHNMPRGAVINPGVYVL
jgi:hypothetical protein